MNESSTKFNAGLSIAEELQNYLKNASYSRINENLPLAHSFLRSAELIMSPKFRMNKIAEDEINFIHNQYNKEWSLFMRKSNKQKKIPKNVYNSALDYLDNYKKALAYYADKFGYGMPSKEDLLKPEEEW